jgi:predicted GNAT family acetyltransferase
VAELLYEIENNIMSIYHTSTPPEDRGRGIAKELTEKAFAFAKEHGFKIRPDCSYAKFFVENNSEYASYIVSE